MSPRESVETLKSLYRDLAENERLIKALCEEFWKACPVYYVTLYWCQRKKNGPIQGPYWALLRRRRIGGKPTCTKKHVGMRMTKELAYRHGLMKLWPLLERMNRRARELRRRHARLARITMRIRLMLRPYF